MGTETGDLHVVTQQMGLGGDLRDFAGEELFLIIETGAPGEIDSNLQIFAETVAHHVPGVNALRRIGVMRAAGRVDVMVSRIPAVAGRIDPPLESEFQHA